MLTIEEARKKLGKRSEKLTDKEVQTMIMWLTRLCEKVIDDVVKK